MAIKGMLCKFKSCVAKQDIGVWKVKGNFNFTDLTLYKRIEIKDGVCCYFNLTEFEIGAEGERIFIEEDEEYIIVYEAIFNRRKILLKEPILYSCVTIDDIMKIAGLKESTLLKKESGKSASTLMKSKFKDLVFAELILNASPYNKRVKCNEKNIAEYQKRVPTGEDKKHRTYQTFVTLEIKQAMLLNRQTK